MRKPTTKSVRSYDTTAPTRMTCRRFAAFMDLVLAPGPLVMNGNEYGTASRALAGHVINPKSVMMTPSCEGLRRLDEVFNADWCEAERIVAERRRG